MEKLIRFFLTYRTTCLHSTATQTPSLQNTHIYQYITWTLKQNRIIQRRSWLAIKSAWESVKNIRDTEWQSGQFSSDLFPTRRLKPSANELVKSNLRRLHSYCQSANRQEVTLRMKLNPCHQTQERNLVEPRLYLKCFEWQKREFSSFKHTMY